MKVDFLNKNTMVLKNLLYGTPFKLGGVAYMVVELYVKRGRGLVDCVTMNDGHQNYFGEDALVTRLNGKFVEE